MRVIYYNTEDKVFFVDGGAFRSDDYKTLEELKENHLKQSQLRHHGQSKETRIQIYAEFPKYVLLSEFKKFTNHLITKVKSQYPEIFL